MGMAVPIMAIVGTAISAYGAYQQAQAQKEQSEYNAAIAENNAIIERDAAKRNMQLAEDAIERGRVEEYRTRLRTEQAAAQQKSALAASGVVLNTGTPLDLLSDTYALGEMDALTVRNNYAREANQYEAAAYGNKTSRNSAKMTSQLHSNTASQINPMMSAGKSFLSGTPKIYESTKKAGWWD